MVVLIYMIAIISSLFSAELHFFHKKGSRNISDILYAIFTLASVWTTVAYVLILTGLMNELPWFYKTAAPINLVIPPLGFLYVKYVLLGEKKLQKTDCLHFLPALLMFFNYLPFYLMPISEKIEIVRNVTSNLKFQYSSQDGIIPEPLYYIIRGGQSFIYVIIQSIYINKFKQRNPWVKNTLVPRKVIFWLQLYTAIYAIIFIAFISILFLLSYSNNANLTNVNLIPSLIVAVCSLVINGYFLANYDLFYQINNFNKYKPVYYN
jgi:hypothetical protein